MKKLKIVLMALFAVVLMGAVFVSCEKKEEAPEPEGTVSFNLINYALDGLKGGVIDDETGLPECSDQKPCYALLVIDGTEYRVDLFDVDGDGGIETQELKFLEGSYTLESAAIFACEDANNDGQDDIIWLSPKEESQYGGYLEYNVPKRFDVIAFNKVKNPLDVLCFKPTKYVEFGYKWWEVFFHLRKDICFYGNICTKFYEEFHSENIPNNPYVGQEYDGVFFNAIFEVTLKDGDGNVVMIGDNVEAKGGQFCLYYIDEAATPDEEWTFEIRLIEPDNSKLLVHVGTVGEDSWSNVDESPNPFGGADGVFDFVIGNCVGEGGLQPDLKLPAYIPLPDQISFKLKTNSSSSYFKLEVSSVVGAGALDQIKVGDVLAWCGDKFATIYANQNYVANLYSSLDFATLPVGYQSYGASAWAKLNWIFNQDLSGYTKNQVQAAVWYILHNGGAGSQVAGLTDAAVEYNPLPGDWAVVLVDPIESADDNEFQLIVVQVDP